MPIQDRINELTLFEALYIAMKLIEIFLGGLFVIVVSSHTYYWHETDKVYYTQFNRDVIASICLVNACIPPTMILFVICLAHRRTMEAQRKSLFDLCFNALACVFTIVADCLYFTYCGTMKPEELTDEQKKYYMSFVTGQVLIVSLPFWYLLSLINSAYMYYKTE